MTDKRAGMRPETRVPESSRRIDRIEEIQQANFEKTDADRHKLVRKARPGAVRVCPGCGAVSLRKRWRLGAEAPAGKEIEATRCPGCRRLADGRVDGYVELRGAILSQRGDEFRNLIENVATEARTDDPVHRIASFVVMADRMVIETTSQWLAETLGKAVARHCRGDLRLQFSPGEDFVRVYWTQD